MDNIKCSHCQSDITNPSHWGFSPIYCENCQEELDWVDIQCKEQVSEEDGTQKEIFPPVELVEVTFEIDEDLFNEFKTICDKEGVTVEQAINMFFRACIKAGGIPFSVQL